MTEAELKEALEYDAKRRELERAAFTERIDRTVAGSLEKMLKENTESTLAAGREAAAKENEAFIARRVEDLARHEAERKASHRLGIASGLLANHAPIPTEPDAMRRYARQALQMADVLLDEARK